MARIRETLSWPHYIFILLCIVGCWVGWLEESKKNNNWDKFLANCKITVVRQREKAYLCPDGITYWR